MRFYHCAPVLCAVGLLCCLSTISGSSRKVRQTINSNVNYARWKPLNQASVFYYYLDTAFTTAEAAMVQAAIDVFPSLLPAINSSAPCITFTKVLATDSKWKTKFTPLTGGPGSQPQTYCYSSPGIDLNAQKLTAAPNLTEQIVSLARGATGCLFSQWSVLRYIAAALGRRNEHERGDRDTGAYLTMTPANYALPAAYKLYTSPADAIWSVYPYDYCSITHNQPGDFALPGTKAFTVPNAPNYIPQLKGLSQIDCLGLSILYSCPYLTCTNGATTAPLFTAIPSCTVQAATPAALCTGIDFSTKVIDEATVLADGRQVLFYGNCYIEFDPTTNKIKPTTSGLISDLFPGVTGPVQAVWLSPATTQHILLQTGIEWACTGTTTTTCAVETALNPLNIEARFEQITAATAGAAATYATWFVIAGGQVFADDATNTFQFLTAVVCPAAATPPVVCANPLTTWTSAWASANNVVSVIGTSADGKMRVQQMTYNALVNLWVYNADAVFYY